MKGLSQEEAAIANYIHSTIENIMAHTQQIPEGPLRDEPTNPRTRIVGMKWVELGKGKDPEFDKQVFLFEPPATYCTGSLSGIHLSPTGKIFTFTEGDVPWTNQFTHYAIPQPPK